jgi:hypothetical protein
MFYNFLKRMFDIVKGKNFVVYPLSISISKFMYIFADGKY